MKWTNRQYVDLMTYNHPERPMFSELFGPIVGLAEEWRAQGATEDQIAMRGFAFDYVPYYQLGDLDSVHRPKEVVLEDNERYYVAIDHYGRRVRMDKGTSTIPLPENYPVETMDDWLKIKHMFEYDACRLPAEEIEKAKKLQSEGTLIKSEILGGFDILRELMGEENCCIAFYEDPELIFDILNTISETNVRVLSEIISSGLVIDQLSVHEDMAGKTAPLIGPATVSEYIIPYYLKSWELVKGAGTKLFCQDSDGNMNPLIDTFIEGGINIFYPCEPAGGMDIVALRKKYGHKIAFRGGIDKHVLRRTKEEIDAELAYKMQPCMMDGGIVFGLDHRIPNGTPLENYIHYVDRAREILGMPDFRTSEMTWGRMAF
ncbi:MAG: hypothetical protein KH382_09250 [Clostridiales bacterium]|nr:hypothetical protein [Clostridiales bacterium]